MVFTGTPRLGRSSLAYLSTDGAALSRAGESAEVDWLPVDTQTMEVDAIDGGDGRVGVGGRRLDDDDGDEDVSLPWEQYTPDYIGRDGPSGILSPHDDDGDDDGGGVGRAPHPSGGAAGGKSSLRTRWLVLILTCLAMSGPYYAYDVPSSLHQQLEDYMPSTSSSYETQFNLLYTVYSVPNVVLPLFGGSFVDRFGGPRCMAAFAATVCAGSAILSAGVAGRSWNAMYVGRFVFGLGAESMCVAQSTVVREWFEGESPFFLFDGLEWMALSKLALTRDLETRLPLTKSINRNDFPA